MGTVTRLGEEAPDFELSDLEGRRHRLSDQRGTLIVLHIWSAACPWTEQTDDQVVKAIRAEGADLWSIAPNADEDEGLLREEARKRSLPLVLRDPEQHVADLYGAIATPHVFVIDEQGVLRYQGAVDDSRFRRPTPDRYFLAEALAAVRRGENPDPAETPTYGCAIVRAA